MCRTALFVGIFWSSVCFLSASEFLVLASIVLYKYRCLYLVVSVGGWSKNGLSQDCWTQRLHFVCDFV